MSKRSAGEPQSRRRSKPTLFEPVLGDITKANCQILVRSFEQISFRKAEAEFDQLKRTVLTQNQWFVLQVRRLHAEMVFHAAIRTNLPVQECRKYFARIVRMGFPDLYQEAIKRVIFARYLLEVGENVSALRMLRKLRSVIRRRTLSRGEKRQLMELRKTIDLLLGPL